MRRRGLTFVELMIAIVVVAIVGGALVSALMSFYDSYSSTEDYTLGREEVERAFRVVAEDFSNAGLGLSLDGGQFAAAFYAGGSEPPLMAHMGDIQRGDMAWGGAMTVADGDLPDKAVKTTTSSGCYVGHSLYCVWAVPTGVLLSPDFGVSPALPRDTSKGCVNYEKNKETAAYWNDAEKPLLKLYPIDGASGIGRLKDFKTNRGREIGVLTDIKNHRSWIVLPSFGVPLQVKTVNADHLEARVAPFAFASSAFTTPDKKILLGGQLRGLEEVCLLQVVRLQVRDGRLIRSVYEEHNKAPVEDAVAENIAAACFRFDPASRLLTMTLAARGINNPKVSPGVPESWPKDEAPVEDYFSARDRNLRLLVESMTWRIRN